MFDIFNLIHTIYGNGYAGVIIALLAIVIYLLRKIATNHLSHMCMKLDAIKNSVTDLAVDVKETNLEIKSMKLNCIAHGEKIAHLEGKLENETK